MIKKKVKISSFYVVDSAKDGLDKCVGNGGVCEKLDVNNEASGAKLLTDCISKQILQKIGEIHKCAEKLLTEYNK